MVGAAPPQDGLLAPLTVAHGHAAVLARPADAVAYFGPSALHLATNVENLTAALRIELGQDVTFEGFGLTTGLTGALQLKGGSQRAYTGQGTLSLVGGRYKAYGQELDIRRGDLIFNGPLDSPELDVQADAVPLTLAGSDIMFTTDGFTVQPLEFPGGNIGSLAVHGTINDLAMCGARPHHLSLAFIIEEGFAVADLEAIVRHSLAWERKLAAEA